MIFFSKEGAYYMKRESHLSNAEIYDNLDNILSRAKKQINLNTDIGRQEALSTLLVIPDVFKDFSYSKSPSVVWNEITSGFTFHLVTNNIPLDMVVNGSHLVAMRDEESHASDYAHNSTINMFKKNNVILKQINECSYPTNLLGDGLPNEVIHRIIYNSIADKRLNQYLENKDYYTEIIAVGDNLTCLGKKLTYFDFYIIVFNKEKEPIYRVSTFNIERQVAELYNEGTILLNKLNVNIQEAHLQTSSRMNTLIKSTKHSAFLSKKDNDGIATVKALMSLKSMLIRASEHNNRNAWREMLTTLLPLPSLAHFISGEHVSIYKKYKKTSSDERVYRGWLDANVMSNISVDNKIRNGHLLYLIRNSEWHNGDYYHRTIYDCVKNTKVLEVTALEVQDIDKEYNDENILDKLLHYIVNEEVRDEIRALKQNNIIITHIFLVESFIFDSDKSNKLVSPDLIINYIENGKQYTFRTISIQRLVSDLYMAGINFYNQYIDKDNELITTITDTSKTPIQFNSDGVFYSRKRVIL